MYLGAEGLAGVLQLGPGEGEGEEECAGGERRPHDGGRRRPLAGIYTGTALQDTSTTADSAGRNAAHTARLYCTTLHSLPRSDGKKYLYEPNFINLFSIVKLREREGQRVDSGRSLKGHL